MHHTRHFSNRLAITAMIAILLVPTAAAYSGPGYIVGEDGNFFGGEEKNMDNWPQSAIELCAGAQARVIKQCMEAGFENWYVERMISGQGTYNGKSLNVNFEDNIFGPSKCPPSEDITPAGVSAGKIISESIDYMKSTAEKGLSDDAEITCSFTCYKWECPEDFNPYKLCDARIVSEVEYVAGKITRAPDASLKKAEEISRGRCQEMGKSKYCRVEKCESQILPGAIADQQIVRVCCDCTCPDVWFPETPEWKWKEPLDEYFEEQKEKQETAEELIQRVRDHFSRLRQERENLKRVYEQQKALIEVLREKNKQCRGMVEIPPPTIEKPAVQITLPTAPQAPPAVTCNIPMFRACADTFNPQECVNACPYVQIECPAGAPQTECKEIDKECSNQCLVKMDLHINNCLESNHCTKEDIIAGGGAPR